jgi:hypothetical protein
LNYLGKTGFPSNHQNIQTMISVKKTSGVALAVAAAAMLARVIAHARPQPVVVKV